MCSPPAVGSLSLSLSLSAVLERTDDQSPSSQSELNLSSLTHMAAAAGTHVPPSGQQRQKEKQKKADDSAHARMTDAARSKPSSSALFVPFRALGLISDGVAFALQRRGKETFLVTSVGTSWQVRFLISLFTSCLPSRLVHSTHPSSLPRFLASSLPRWLRFTTRRRFACG